MVSNFPESNKIMNDKLAGYDKYYQMFSEKLSGVCKQLALIEGGAFWILKGNNKPDLLMLFGLFFLVLYFIADTFQYYFGMRGYENLAEITREAIKNGNACGLGVDNKNANFKIEWCLKIKFYCLIISSGVLIASFIYNFIS